MLAKYTSNIIINNNYSRRVMMTEFLMMIFPAIVLTIGFAYIVVKDNKKMQLKTQIEV